MHRQSFRGKWRKPPKIMKISTTWMIIPLRKWLVKKATSQFMGDLLNLLATVINHYLNGMVLQVDGFPLSDCWAIQASVISSYQTNPNKWTTYLMIFCMVFSFQSGKKIRTIQETGDPARTYADVIKSWIFEPIVDSLKFGGSTLASLTHAAKVSEGILWEPWWRQTRWRSTRWRFTRKDIPVVIASPPWEL